MNGIHLFSDETSPTSGLRIWRTSGALVIETPECASRFQNTLSDKPICRLGWKAEQEAYPV